MLNNFDFYFYEILDKLQFYRLPCRWVIKLYKRCRNYRLQFIPSAAFCDCKLFVFSYHCGVCFKKDTNVCSFLSITGFNMSTSTDLGSPSPLIPLGQIKQEPDLHTPSRRRAKLKPDLKLKVWLIRVQIY